MNSGNSRLGHDKGAVFLEYAMLLAMMTMVLTVMLPGGMVYDYLRQEVLLRVILVSLPIF